MKYKVYYTLAKEYNGCSIGTKIRVHDWNNTHVQISINGCLEYVPIETFEKIVNK